MRVWALMFPLGGEKGFLVNMSEAREGIAGQVMEKWYQCILRNVSRVRLMIR